MMESNDRGRSDDRGEYRDGRRQTAESGRGGPSAALILLILVAIAVIVFVVQNGDAVEIDWLFIHGEVPLWILIAISLAIGVILTRLASFIWRRARRHDD